MARSYVARQLVKLGGQPVWREGVVTDNGNVILDVHHLRARPTRTACEDRDRSDRRSGHGRPVRARGADVTAGGGR